MAEAGAMKAALPPTALLIRGCLSGALLGIAASLALGTTVQTGQLLVRALIFPVGFVMIILLGPELATGSLALLPMAVMAGRIKPGQMASNWSWVLPGNLIDSVVYAVLSVIFTFARKSAETVPALGQSRIGQPRLEEPGEI